MLYCMYLIENNCFSMLHSFADCVDKIQINQMHVCPERYIWTNVMSNPEFYTSIVDGFNPYDCICKYKSTL